MKRLLNVTFWVVILLSFFLGAQKITIKTVDGVQVIYNPKNPSPPKDGFSKVAFRLDLSIGENETEEELFSEMTSIALDKQDNIYILDRKENKIKTFDSNGKFVREFGKGGQGPGEMNQPIGVHITPKNELIVDDILNRRLVFFSLEGKFIKNVSTAKVFGFGGAMFDFDGNVIARQFAVADNKANWELRKYDEDLSPIFLIASTKLPYETSRKIDPFSLALVYAIGKGNQIYYGGLQEYDIKVLTPEGKLQKRVLKEYDKRKITEKDKRKFLEALPVEAAMIKNIINFPKFFPAYHSFIVDERGRILVRTYEKGKEEGEYRFDIFDEDGRYIEKIFLKGDHRIWRKRKLYIVGESEYGFHVLKRYSELWER